MPSATARRGREATVFLPCRAGSVRVHDKNTRPFAGRPDGLVGLKLQQLSETKRVHRVVLDSNDAKVLEIGRAHQASWKGKPELVVRERPDALGSSETTTDELVSYALDTLEGDVMLWTHVTSPFADARVYDAALRRFESLQPPHDSLMSVRRVQSFLWNAQGPLNYDPKKLRWPKTQDLEPILEVDSAIFIVDMALGRRLRDRVGNHPFLYELSRIESVDIDWEEDFSYAEAAARMTR